MTDYFEWTPEDLARVVPGSSVMYMWRRDEPVSHVRVDVSSISADGISLSNGEPGDPGYVMAFCNPATLVTPSDRVLVDPVEGNSQPADLSIYLDHKDRRFFAFAERMKEMGATEVAMGEYSAKFAPQPRLVQMPVAPTKTPTIPPWAERVREPADGKAPEPVRPDMSTREARDAYRAKVANALGISTRTNDAAE